jgi:hypothetical protein
MVWLAVRRVPKLEPNCNAHVCVLEAGFALVPPWLQSQRQCLPIEKAERK